jgi:hypothetical protein
MVNMIKRYKLLPLVFLLISTLFVATVQATTVAPLGCVDLGEDADELTNICGWGRIEPQAWDNSWGNIPEYNKCRVISASSEFGDLESCCGCSCCDTIDTNSSIIRIPVSTPSTPLKVYLDHLDGSANDTFKVWICDGDNWVYLGAYLDEAPADDSEKWLTKELEIPSEVYTKIAGDSYVCLKLRAEGPKWSGWTTYGQVAFEKICIEGWSFVIPEVPYGTIATVTASMIGLTAYMLRKKKLF